MNDLSDHNQRLSDDEKELRRILEGLCLDIKELEERKSKVNNETELLKSHLDQFEKERLNNDAEYLRAIQERDNTIDY
mgnify:CR=1 FL=1